MPILTWNLKSKYFSILNIFRFRWCGPARFTAYGALRLICLRKVYAALYYLPEESSLSLQDIPSLSDPLTGDFIRENELYSYFTALNVAWIGESMQFAPKAQLDDGFSDIIKMNSRAGRLNLAKQLINMDTGDYFDKNGDLNKNSGLEYIKTKCWRLIPKTQLSENDDTSENRNLTRFYSIDGEKYPIEPIQVKTLRRSLRVFCLD